MNYRIEKIAEFFVNKLGANHFNLDVNCNLNLDGDIVQGIMFATRRPFKINNINAESIELNFEWYVSVKNTTAKLDVLNTLSRITGALSGYFNDGGVDYTINTFIDFGRPTTAPVVDMGDYTQVVLMSGTCLITNSISGALISNDVITEIYDKNPGSENAVGGPVAVLSANTVLTKVVASPQKLNKNKATTYCSTQQVTTTLSILYLKNQIDNKLLEHINLYNDESANKTYYLRRQFPTYTILREVKLIQGSITENAGAFLQYEIVLQGV